jgi:hydroxyacylglutathione hydrolase
MRIVRYMLGPLQTNCYQVICEKTNTSVVIDPGGTDSSLLQAVRDHPIQAILLTHGHFDHTAGLGTLAAETGVPVFIHEKDRAMLDNPYLNGSFLMGVEIGWQGETKDIREGDAVAVGESSLTVIESPGHTPGGVMFRSGEEFAVTGDTLFRNSVGRWDLPGGDYSALMNSIRRIAGSLPDQIALYPGHGDATTLKFEKKFNEFLRQP